ncbi:hypothetical protein MAPG_04959 [Magnaporthiopsis poae ATCC 64411]|uniref:Uncharacterized protein n=1 Tax=Magnaporthiopsis poae (strain ATCC 64411 / 73-15) TaxID=644358 RepID=A0A0C4DY50_MAGP6|nr:hypothetical protein MAPG_04959 [Magnaporthiopsis poae ATCC 64411]
MATATRKLRLWPTDPPHSSSAFGSFLIAVLGGWVHWVAPLRHTGLPKRGFSFMLACRKLLVRCCTVHATAGLAGVGQPEYSCVSPGSNPVLFPLANDPALWLLCWRWGGRERGREKKVRQGQPPAGERQQNNKAQGLARQQPNCQARTKRRHIGKFCTAISQYSRRDKHGSTAVIAIPNPVVRRLLSRSRLIWPPRRSRLA